MSKTQPIYELTDDEGTRRVTLADMWPDGDAPDEVRLLDLGASVFFGCGAVPDATIRRVQ